MRMVKLWVVWGASERDPALATVLADDAYGAMIERGMMIQIEAFDWNCPRHITRRYTLAELTPTLNRLKQSIAELEAAPGSASGPKP